MSAWTVLAYLVASVVLVILADRSDARRFACGCKWPAEDDGPAVVECPCGLGYEFRPWTDQRGRVRDAWDTTFRYEAMPNWWIYDETDVTILDEEMPEELLPDGASGRDRQNDAAGEETT